MTTPENQPPAWNPPTAPPPAAYTPLPGQYLPPSAEQAPPPPHPPAQPTPPPAAQPTNPLGAPPVLGPAPVLAPPTAPKKKSALAKIGSVAGAILIAAVVIAVKVGLGSALSSDSTPKNPFEKTAAESYAHGAAGIVVPAASAVPGFTRDQVAAALANVKQAMIAGRLSDAMLYQHDKTALVALFSQFGAEGVDGMFTQKLGGVVATMIAPGQHLTDDPIRVKGDMSFQSGTVDGVTVLNVKTNFVWIYPFTGQLKTTGDHLVSLHDQITWVFPAQDEVAAKYVGMYLDEHSQFVASNVDCDLFKQDLIALGKPVAVSNGDAGNPSDALDPNGSMDIPQNLAC